MYSIINNIYLSYEHFVSPYLQKGAVKKVVKCIVMLEVKSQKSKKYAKEAKYIYYQNIISLIRCGNIQSSISFLL
jgi:hypothetical protein